MQLPADEGADEHQERENRNILQCVCQDHRIDNIRGDQDLKRKLDARGDDLFKFTHA